MERAEFTELTLLMPCLDEAETLAGCIEQGRRALDELGVAGEIVVADNGSTDGSPAIAERTGARIVHVPERGYGAALLGGIAAARGRYVVMADADASYDFREIGPFLERLRDGADLVMGCRLPSGGGKILTGAMPFLHRWLGNPGLSWLGRVLFGCPVTDFHCGMRGFSREALLGLDVRTTGMEFASEMVIKATFRGLRIVNVPITLHPDGRTRPPHLRTFRDGWRHLRFMLLHSPKGLFLVPGTAALGTGALGFAVLLPGPLRIGGVGLDANTLLVCAFLILTGFQWISFGMSARLYATQHGLIPPDDSSWIQTHLSLERGIVIGGFVGLAGLCLLVYAVYAWSTFGFGPFPAAIGLRLVIPAVTAMALGAQIVLSSFFISMLRLKLRGLQ